MSGQSNSERFTQRLTEISEELRSLATNVEPKGKSLFTIDEAFEEVTSLYKNDASINVELISMQSGLHENTVRKLFKDKNAFMSAKLSTVMSFLATLGISLRAER